jgi:hypothetical protein
MRDMKTLGPTPIRLLVSAILLQAALDARSEIQTGLSLLKDRVREGERRIRRQREIVHKLTAEGRETELAARTLRNFEKAQELILRVAQFERSIRTCLAQLGMAARFRTTAVRS